MSSINKSELPVILVSQNLQNYQRINNTSTISELVILTNQ